MGKKRFSSIPEYKDGDTITYLITLDPKEICYIQALLEGYEGVGIMRTRDGDKGIVEFWIPPSRKDIFEAFIESLKKEVTIYSIKITEDHYLGP